MEGLSERPSLVTCKIEVLDEVFRKQREILNNPLALKFRISTNVGIDLKFLKIYRLPDKQATIVEGEAPPAVVTFHMAVAQGHLTQELLEILSKQMTNWFLAVLDNKQGEE